MCAFNCHLKIFQTDVHVRNMNKNILLTLFLIFINRTVSYLTNLINRYVPETFGKITFLNKNKLGAPSVEHQKKINDINKF